ncbi:hypothetical protein NBRC10513v2_003031 [Rhodotorula toruloides]|uniref:Proteophosphoglycan ppg4 n=1 Tax=Rhodotorula toruloides TaxID=5286 RepID=A0A0K3CDJ3_RHOTO|nr:hypothetical protein AAT19DRAFT_14190 [Rhodotorula toruloides]
MPAPPPPPVPAQLAVQSWSFDLLPLELKKWIAQRCRQQDDWARSCLDTVSSFCAVEGRDAENLKQHVKDLRRTYGSSVGALFRLSKAWSAAVAPYRFSHCKVSRTTSFLFRNRIAPLYGQYFHTLEFDKSDQATLQWLLLLLPFMPKIEDLRLTLDGFERVLQPQTYYNPASMLQVESLSLTFLVSSTPLTFEPLLARLTTIHFELGSWSTLQKLADAAKSLRELQVYKLANYGRGDPGVSQLASILVSCPLLETLHVPPSEVSAFRPTWGQPLPRIRSLTLDVDGDMWLIRLASHFADSLENFSLRFITAHGCCCEVSHVFPHVKAIEASAVTKDSRFFLTFPASINPTAFPALESFTFHAKATSANEVRDAVDRLRQAIQKFDEAEPGNNLRQIHVSDRLYPLPRWAMTRLQAAVGRADRKITAGPVEPFVSSFALHAEFNRAADNGTVWAPSEAVTSIEGTLSFVHGWFERAKAADDGSDLAKIAVALGRAELERVVRTGSEAAH